MNETNTHTLREGLIQLRQENAAIFSDRNISPDAQEFFRCHDTAHVVFGCDTSLFGEGILKIYTIFGTTLGFWRHLSAYSEASAFALFRQYSLAHLCKHILKLIGNAPRAIVRARRMSKPWPWTEHGAYLDKPVAEIRKEFNIIVIQPEQAEWRKLVWHGAAADVYKSEHVLPAETTSVEPRH